MTWIRCVDAIFLKATSLSRRNIFSRVTYVIQRASHEQLDKYFIVIV
jgi:hypothetical protein